MKRTKQQNTKLITTGIILLVLVLAVAAYAFTGNKASKNNPTVTPQATASTMPTPTPIPTMRVTPAPGGGAAGQAAPSTPVSQGSTLPTPTGAFLSSAKVSLGGSEETTCTTAHGVACYLIIKNSGGTEVGRLLVPEVDGNGGHLLDWSVNKTISSAGKYTVSALAVSGTKTASSGAYDLEVIQ